MRSFPTNFSFDAAAAAADGSCFGGVGSSSSSSSSSSSFASDAETPPPPAPTSTLLRTRSSSARTTSSSAVVSRMSSSPSGARSRRFPRRVFVFVFFFFFDVSVSSTAASATIAALTASAGSSASASYLSATSSITLASAPSTSSASTTAATSRNAPFASCAGCVQYSCHAARAPSRCLMMVAPRAQNVTFTGGQLKETNAIERRNETERTGGLKRVEKRSNRTRLYAASASTTEGGGGGARSPNVAGVVDVHHRNASAADDGRLRLRLDAASRRSAASDAVDAFDAADGGRRARAVPGRRPIAALPGLRANVGVELKGVRSGVERQRGRGLKARGARRDATGKVLKESRSPRQRGRMGTSV